MKEKMQHNKNALMKTAWITAAIGVLIGLLLILIPVDFLIRLVFLVMGIVTVATSLPGLLNGIKYHETREGMVSLVLSTISIFIGFVMIFWNNGILMLILGAYMLVFPIVNVILAQDRMSQFKSEIPKLILGVVLLVLGPAGTIGLLFDIAGIVLIVLSLLYVLMSYLTLRRRQNTPGSRIFADTDGNGSIDAVYVDTDNNGRADTATHYKEKK